MKKRILSIVLSIVMLVSLLPTTAFAVSSDIIVGGANLGDGSTTVYYKNGDTSGNLTGTAEDYNAKLETVGGVATLTIKNLSVTGTAASHYAGIFSTVGLNIVLEGGNSVTGGALGTDDGITIAGIDVCGNVTITGSGTLSATGGTATGTSGSRGIVCDNLTLADDDIVINAAGGSTESGSNFGSYGINAANMNISAGVVNATGGTATGGASRGISATQTVEISGGTVNATGGTAGTSKYSIGIDCSGTLSIGGNATVNATGGSAGKTCGIYSNDVRVTGGVTVATGGTASGTSSGIYHYSSANVTTTGGVLVARAGSGETTKAINGTLTTNGTKIAGQVVGSTFTGSPASYDGNATAVAIVPSDFADGSSLDFSSGSVTLDKNYYIVNDGTSALKLNADTAINTNSHTLLAVSLHSGNASDFGINGSFSASGGGSVISVAGTGVNNAGTGSYGVNGDLTVDNATVTAIGGPGGFGVNGKYDSASTEPSVNVLSGTLNAIGGSSGSTSQGIWVSRPVAVSSGVVNAIGGSANGDVDGIIGDLNISDGTVNALAGPSSSNNSYGVRGNVTAIGGALNALGGKTVGNSYGIYANSSVSISATANVTAIGGVAGSGRVSDGIYAEEVDISGTGEIIAMGRTYGLRTASGTLAGGNFAGGTNAISTTSGTVKNLLATGYGYFAGETQLSGDATTVGSANQTVTVKEIPIPHSHCVCGAEHKSIGDHTTETSKNFEAWDNATSLPQSGSYYLNTDVVLTATANITGELNLCLNGHTISAAGGYFDVAGTGTLNLCSCKDNGIIKRTTTTNALICADGGAKANLYNVTLDGGAVWSGDVDTVLERGTTNSSCISSSAPLIDAGGETPAGGFVVLMNCELRNNVCSGAGEGGAITVGRQGSLTATKTNVYNNAKTDGQAGAIKAYTGATVNLTRCELYGNKAVAHGGAIQGTF